MSRWSAVFAADLHGLVSRAFALVAMLSLFIALAVGMAGGLWLQGRSQSANLALVAQNAASVAVVPLVFNDPQAAREVLRPTIGGRADDRFHRVPVRSKRIGCLLQSRAIRRLALEFHNQCVGSLYGRCCCSRNDCSNGFGAG